MRFHLPAVTCTHAVILWRLLPAIACLQQDIKVESTVSVNKANPKDIKNIAAFQAEGYISLSVAKPSKSNEPQWKYGFPE